jgi:glycosyltransferase involved in cell wall biosynthesis
MTKTLIIVPAFNEAENIKNVIYDILEQKKNYDILIINDCSADNTSKAARETESCKVIDLPVNLGIGGAVQTGFKYAFENGYEYTVQFDGDGQHKAAEIEKILDPVKEGEADVVIGSRFLKKEPNFRSSFARRKGIFIFKVVNFILTGQKITDNTSGFRAYNKRAIGFLSHNYPEDYPEPESVVLLGRNGFKIMEVSVSMKERQNGSSSIYGFRIPYYMFKVLLSVIMTGMRRKLPVN